MSSTSQRKMIKCYNPATMQELGEIPAMTKEDVDAAIAKAVEAQKEWKHTSFDERRKVLKAIKNYILENQDEICRLSCEDTGKTMLEASFGEVMTSCEKIRYMCKFGEKHLKPEYRYVPMLLASKSARVEYRPYGVIGIIIPWNYPFHNMLSHVITALFAGNAAVVKVSEWATWSSVIFGRMLKSILESCGHSPDLIQIITGYGDSGAAVVENPQVGKVLFIGSDANGRRVMETAAKTVKPVVLELGGKDPFIVCDDADLPKTVLTAMRGVFVNNGQNCITAERLYVHEAVYDEFIDSVLKIFKQMRQGPPLAGCTIDSGAMTMPAQLNIVEDLVQDAISKGARVLWGGKRNPHCGCSSDVAAQFFEPTLLVDCNHSMRIVKEETFGPVMVVMKWKTDEEVIEMANDCIYGLSSCVFSKDYKRAERIASQLESGSSIINDFGIPYLIQSLPFGGVKKSGFGKFNGPEGLREFTYQKVVVTDRFGIRAPVPKFTALPTPDNAYEVSKEATTMIYSDSYWESIKAGWRFVSKFLGSN